MKKLASAARWMSGFVIFALCGAAPSSAETPDQLAAYAASIISPWESAHCDPPRLDFPRWEGFPVRLCDYRDIGVTVRTYMLNPNRAKQARWTVTACFDAQARDMRRCIDYMVGVVRTASSGGVFPVAGYIPEPQDGGICYLFRDGVTIWSELRRRWQPPRGGRCGDVDETNARPFRAFKYARIASTTRPEYSAAGGRLPVEGLQWLDTVRKLYQKAWNSDRNELMSATAIQARRDGAF